jgi:hypothetical protein
MSERHQTLPQPLTRLGGAHGVASGEDVGERDLHGLGVDADRTEAGDSEIGRAEEDGIGLGVEAEGLDDEACQQYVFGACDGLDLLSADRVGHGEVGADRLDAVLSKEPDGGVGGEPGDADALLFGVGDFAEGSGHVGAVAVVEASDVGGTLANSGADAVHGGVPAPTTTTSRSRALRVLSGSASWSPRACWLAAVRKARAGMMPLRSRPMIPSVRAW